MVKFCYCLQIFQFRESEWSRQLDHKINSITGKATINFLIKPDHRWEPDHRCHPRLSRQAWTDGHPCHSPHSCSHQPPQDSQLVSLPHPDSHTSYWTHPPVAPSRASQEWGQHRNLPSHRPPRPQKAASVSWLITGPH